MNYTITIIAFFAFACFMMWVDKTHPNDTPASKSDSAIIMTDYTIRLIDSCEYIEVSHKYGGSGQRTYSLTHKGNCSHCSSRKP